MSANGRKSKVMKVGDGEHRDMSIRIGGGEVLEEVASFVYLGVELSEGGGMNIELDHRFNERHRERGV